MVTDGYKKTEIGVIPVEWEVVNIENLNFDISDGNYSSKYPKQSDFIKEGIPFIRANNIKSMTVIDKDMRYISETQHRELKKGHLKQGDLLITTRGDIGQIALVPNKFIDANINAQIVRIGVSSRVNNKYLAYFLIQQHIQHIIKSLETGTALKQLPVKKLGLLSVSLPPLKEQEKIADILSTADDKIDAIASQIQKAQTLKKGLLQKLLSEGIGHSEFKDSELGKIPESWEVDKLENLLDIISGQSPSKFNLTGTKYKFFKVNQLNFCEKYLTNSEYAFDEEIDNLLDSGTVVFPKRGASIFTNKVRILTHKSFIDTNLMGLISNNNLNNIFLYYWIVEFELSNIADTSSVPQINNKHINPLKIPLPPLKEQKQIAEILSTADEKLEVLMNKKEKYETLKKGLLQKLLSGEVRV